MATFSRTGAEANAIAIRIARIFSQKEEIAICGYHGWHDWYLSSNISNKKNLDEIHLSGLSTIGIPKKLKGLTHPFRYNDLKSFKKLLNKNPNIGTVFMEVERNEKPKKNFLKQIRKITKKKNIVLIFDECTSGFRETDGGLHKKYKIYPDIAVFGKSLEMEYLLLQFWKKRNYEQGHEKLYKQYFLVRFNRSSCCNFNFK